MCANDFTAVHLLKTLTDLGVTVPGKVKLAGIDDVKICLPFVRPTDDDTPTLSQHGRHRDHRHDRSRDDPKLPPRDLLLNFDLVVRDPAARGKRN